MNILLHEQFKCQDSHNQVSIANSGGIKSILNLLHSDNAADQHYAARVLYCLTHNEVKLAPLFFVLVNFVCYPLEVTLILSEFKPT